MELRTVHHGLTGRLRFQHILTPTNSNNNTVFENNTNQTFQEENEKYKTANSVLCDAVHSFSRGLLCFQNNMRFQGTRVHVLTLTAIKTALPGPIFTKGIIPSKMSSSLIPNSTQID